MTSFEPPPLPGSEPTPHRRSTAGREPANPYASPPQGSWPGPAPAAPWGPPAQPQHPRATLILVLGILSVTVMQVLGPVAWIMGHTTLREIDGSGQAYANRSSVQAGKILGIVGTVMGIAGLLWMMTIFSAILGILS